MKEVFPIVPAGGAALWVLAIVGFVLFTVAVLLVLFAFSSRHASVEVSPEGVNIRGGLYGRQIPMRSLVLDGARPVNLNTDTALKFSWRTNGIGLPGYCAGWFQLKNGQKALAFITDRSSVAYIPTREGYVLLLSVADPESLIASLKRVS